MGAAQCTMPDHVQPSVFALQGRIPADKLKPAPSKASTALAVGPDCRSNQVFKQGGDDCLQHANGHMQSALVPCILHAACHAHMHAHRHQ